MLCQKSMQFTLLPSLCKFALRIFNLCNFTSKCVIILYTIVSKNVALKLSYNSAREYKTIAENWVSKHSWLF